MRIPSYIVLASLFISIPTLVSAQGIEAVKSTIVSATISIAALSSDDEIGAGTFTLKDTRAPDANLNLYKFAIEFPLISEGDFIPLIEVSPTYLEFEQPLNGQNTQKYEAHAWGVGVGAGVKTTFFDNHLSLTPRMKLEYLEIDNELNDYNYAHQPLSVEVLNSEVDTWSYIPSVETEYNQKISNTDTTVFFYSRVSYIYTDSSPDSSIVEDFSNHSWIFKHTIEAETVLEDLTNGSVILRPSISRIDLRHSARNSLRLNNFYEIGLQAVTQDQIIPIVSEIGVGATYIYEKEIQGWRLGLIGAL